MNDLECYIVFVLKKYIKIVNGYSFVTKSTLILLIE
jgi:hypothetical protein